MTDFSHISSRLDGTISLLSIITCNLLPEHRPAADQLILQLSLCSHSISVAMCQCLPSQRLREDVQASIMCDLEDMSGQQLLDEYTHLRISTISCSVMLMSALYSESSKGVMQMIGEALNEAWMWLTRCDRDRAWHAEGGGVFVA